LNRQEVAGDSGAPIHVEQQDEILQQERESVVSGRAPLPMTLGKIPENRALTDTRAASGTRGSSEVCPRLLPNYMCTQRSHQLVLVMDAMNQINCEMPPDCRCCMFHAATQNLRSICDELSKKKCLATLFTTVGGQCVDCGCLILDTSSSDIGTLSSIDEKQCELCGGKVNNRAVGRHNGTHSRSRTDMEGASRNTTLEPPETARGGTSAVLAL